MGSLGSVGAVRSVRSVGAVVAAFALVAAACGSAPTPAPSAAISSVESVAPSDLASVAPSDSPLPSDSPSPGPTTMSGISIDGVAGDPAVANRLPIAVMIDDNAVARPQAGFNAASIVYQAPADGGEDRYMLVFQEGDAPLVGPVRSGRPYFVRWAAEYRALFGHFGGDQKTLAYIPTISGSLIFNLDALSGSGAAFHRVSTRSAPHNAYTSTASMRSVGIAHGAPSTMVSGLAARLFAPDAPLSARPGSGSISIPYGTGTTSYAYDRASNSYLRSVAGRPQFDAGDGRRVVARSVVVLFMSLSIDPQSEPGYARPVVGQIGTGRALIFTNGRVVVGTWSKRDDGTLTTFLDASGAQVPLVAGRLFIQVVPTGTNVTYQAAH